MSIILILYATYKFYEARQRGKKMNDDTKARNRKTIFRFVQGAVVGSIVTTNLVNLLDSIGDQGVAALILIFAIIFVYRKVLK